MRVRLIWVAILVPAILGHGGCATIEPWMAPRQMVENPLIVPTADFETVWKATIASLNEYFEISKENRLSRTIVTQPKIGATVIEPWSGDSVGFHERLESTLQTIRRFAQATVEPAPSGGFAIKIVVYKELEDMPKPDRQAAGRAVFNNDFPINRSREIVGPVPIPNGWIRLNRDTKLEQEIIYKLRDALLL
ncbi:hypothetical protein [Singulisphaera sp. PoT]|uniref:hypothetical protein n=1 Tax=Singulisphaera sp. PoT TaxID=3411797 RepID=UPI003BF5A0F9